MVIGSGGDANVKTWWQIELVGFGEGVMGSKGSGVGGGGGNEIAMRSCVVTLVRADGREIKSVCDESSTPL